MPFALLHDLASALFGGVQIDGLVNENSPGPCVVHGNDGTPDHSLIFRDVIMLEVAMLPVVIGENGPPCWDRGLCTFERIFGPIHCPLLIRFGGEATSMLVDLILRLVCLPEGRRRWEVAWVLLILLGQSFHKPGCGIVDFWFTIGIPPKVEINFGGMLAQACFSSQLSCC